MTYSQEQYDALLAVCNCYKNDYDKAFERLKSQQREIDRLKDENEFLNRTDEDRCKEVESTIRASIANAGTSCRWCENIIRKKAVKEFAEKLKAVIHDCNFVDGYAETELYDKVDELLEEVEE